MSDIEDRLMARKETEEKREKQLKDHEDRLKEKNHSIRRKNSPQKKESETAVSPTELQNLDYNSMSESQFRSTIIKLLVALEENIKESRDFMTADLDLIRPKLKIN